MISRLQFVACSYEAHADAILAILNDAIVSSTALYDYKPRSPETMIGWFRAKEKGEFPVVGAVAASALLYVIASGAAGFDVGKGFASNGYGEHSPGQYSLIACFIMEVVMTMMFLFIIMGATHGKAPAGFAPLAIGLALVMIHLVSIPVTNTSVNPARSTGPALFVGGWALSQLWLFWVAPLIGGVLGGGLYRWLSDEPEGVVEGRTPA